MDAAIKKQDLPPKGGYAPIVYKRIPAKGYFSGYTWIALYLGMTAVSLGLYSLTYRKRHREDIEMRSSRFAILPMLLAEKDREYLRQLRRNRDSEAELMKNVEGWEVGTLNGEPIYRTVGDDFIFEQTDSHWYVHADPDSWRERVFVHHKM